MSKTKITTLVAKLLITIKTVQDRLSLTQLSTLSFKKTSNYHSPPRKRLSRSILKGTRNNKILGALALCLTKTTIEIQFKGKKQDTTLAGEAVASYHQ
jgi:hypothetical protein